MAQISEQFLAQLDAEFGSKAFAARAASADPFSGYLGGLADWFALLTNITGSLAELMERYGGIEAIIATVEEFYDRVVAPIDLPYLPNLVEPRIDAAIRAQIRPLLLAAYKRLVGEKHQPTEVD